ncbi:hypothetical protein MRX96_049675 [Rhipicephalus microplus]
MRYGEANAGAIPRQLFRADQRRSAKRPVCNVGSGNHNISRTTAGNSRSLRIKRSATTQNARGTADSPKRAMERE